MFNDDEYNNVLQADSHNKAKKNDNLDTMCRYMTIIN